MQMPYVCQNTPIKILQLHYNSHQNTTINYIFQDRIIHDYFYYLHNSHCNILAQEKMF